MVGGVGYNSGFIAALKKELKVATIHIPDEPEFGTAVGAAILAAEAQ
jgi:activator of 2-hydroxyglutaryl-CoA dehydratase